MSITRHQLEEIQQTRAAASQTLRPTVSALEEVLYEPFPVLDNGFVRVIDYMGDDNAVVQAARVSYGRGTKKVTEDRGLIMYLMRHWHTTPFEMADIKFHVKMPIFVARQWIRHRTASVNEYSARYSILDKEFYIPDQQHLAAQSSINRQGRGDILEGDEARRVLELLTSDAERTYSNYAWMLNEEAEGYSVDAERSGLARELARMNLTLNTYTQWYWKANLHNLMGFLRLRADPHAQYEIRAYAEAMLEIMKRWVPISHEAFMEHRMGAASLSRTAIEVVKRIISGEKVSASTSGLSNREWQELCRTLDIPAET